MRTHTISEEGGGWKEGGKGEKDRDIATVRQLERHRVAVKSPTCVRL